MQDKLVPHTICLKRVMASLKAVFHFMAIFLSMVHLDIGNVFPGEITVTMTNDLTLKPAHIAAHNEHDDSLQTRHALVGAGAQDPPPHLQPLRTINLSSATSNLSSQSDEVEYLGSKTYQHRTMNGAAGGYGMEDT